MIELLNEKNKLQSNMYVKNLFNKNVHQGKLYICVFTIVQACKSYERINTLLSTKEQEWERKWTMRF